MIRNVFIFLLIVAFSLNCYAQIVNPPAAAVPSGPAGGGLSGTYPNPGFAANPSFTGTETLAPSGTTNSIKWGASSANPTYGIQCFNGILTTASCIGWEGGGGTDPNLYGHVGASGVYSFRNAGNTGEAGNLNATTGIWNGSGYNISGSPIAFSNIAGTASSAQMAAGFLSGSTGAPTCGTGCGSITSGSTDVRGSATGGTLVTSIIVNFSGTLGFTPFCTCSGSSATAFAGCTNTAAALTINLSTALTGDAVVWQRVK